MKNTPYLSKAFNNLYFCREKYLIFQRKTPKQRTLLDILGTTKNKQKAKPLSSKAATRRAKKRATLKRDKTLSAAEKLKTKRLDKKTFRYIKKMEKRTIPKRAEQAIAIVFKKEIARLFPIHCPVLAMTHKGPKRAKIIEKFYRAPLYQNLVKKYIKDMKDSSGPVISRFVKHLGEKTGVSNFSIAESAGFSVSMNGSDAGKALDKYKTVPTQLAKQGASLSTLRGICANKSQLNTVTDTAMQSWTKERMKKNLYLMGNLMKKVDKNKI
ncbi:MAG: hypothetical protein GWP15_01900 [Nitrospirae bacterium]|nr:hypothetical protein [Nitrospirota bacterium]